MFAESISRQAILTATPISTCSRMTLRLKSSATIESIIFDADFATKERSDNRRFLRLATATDSVVVSYTGISGTTFTGVVGDIDFEWQLGQLDWWIRNNL